MTGIKEKSKESQITTIRRAGYGKGKTHIGILAAFIMEARTHFLKGSSLLV